MQKHQLSAEETWDAIAESFDTTRRTPWKQCLEFISTLQTTAVVADIGCGNGRNLFPAAEHCHHVIGVDISQKLLKIVQKKIHGKNIKNVTLIHADGVELPLADNSIDAVMCIASLHNIQGKERRLVALKEITRVLKPHGAALITVWSRWQKNYYRYFLKQIFLRSQEFGDIDIYWKQHHLNVPRFYHLYSRAEFKKELKTAQLSINNIQRVKIHSKHFPDNYFAVMQKR